jgi:REP element-mobilizing transposase RayT
MKVEYNNLYTHFVFTVFQRKSLINEKHRQRIEKYITGVVNNLDCHLYAIYANPEHVHFLVSRSANISEDALAQIVADSSERFINDNQLSSFLFQWQRTCSAFSVSKSHVDRVCRYILNQKEHHKKTTFADEYDEFIKHYQQTLKFKKDLE